MYSLLRKSKKEIEIALKKKYEKKATAKIKKRNKQINHILGIKPQCIVIF